MGFHIRCFVTSVFISRMTYLTKQNTVFGYKIKSTRYYQQISFNSKEYAAIFAKIQGCVLNVLPCICFIKYLHQMLSPAICYRTQKSLVALTKELILQ